MRSLWPSFADPFTQAAQGGSTYIYQYRGNNFRLIYWARYVDWFFTTPLLLLDILLLAGAPIGTTLWCALVLSFVMTVQRYTYSAASCH